MASPPVIKQLSQADIDDGGEGSLLIANQFMQEVGGALQGRLTRGANIQSQTYESRRFTTPASGNGVLTLAHQLPSKVKHVFATNMARGDGAAITAAWSHTFRNLPNGQVEVQYQGLVASTDYLASLVLE